MPRTNPTTQQPSAKDLLSNLTAGKKPKKTAAPSRPEMQLTPFLEEAFIRLAGADALDELVEARIKQAKELLNDGCFQLWSERLWKQRNQPANPQIKVEKDGSVDMEGIYMVVQKYTYNMQEVPPDKTLEEVVIKQLSDGFVATGMTQDEADTAATDLVTNELTLSPKPIIDLDKLVNGHYEGVGKDKTFVDASAQEQAVASKLIRMINARSQRELNEVGCFTDDEQSLLIEYKAQIVVKKGFLQRVCGYVHSLDQLRQIFAIVKPIRYPMVKKFAASGTPEEKNRRLLEVACDILGVTAP